MKPFISAVKKFAKDEDGITAIEYGLIAALMAAAIVVAVAVLGPGLLTAFQNITDILTAA